MCLTDLQVYRLEIHWYFRPSLGTVAPIVERTMKTTNPKCCLYWCLIEFTRVYRLKIQSVMLVFSTPLVYCCPSTFSLTPPRPSQSKRTVYTYRHCVAVGRVGVGGVEMCCEHILHKLNVLFLTRFRIYKIATPCTTRSKNDQ
jgi:hypothetical protein